MSYKDPEVHQLALKKEKSRKKHAFGDKYKIKGKEAICIGFQNISRFGYSSRSIKSNSVEDLITQNNVTLELG